MRISDWSSDVCSSDLTIPDALRNGIVLMDRRFAIEARYATCRKDASGHQLWIMEIDGHLRTIDQTGCGASSAPIPERNVVIVIDLYAAPGADLREAGGKAGPHQADMARKCGIDMLLNKLWYRHLCSLSCTSMLRRVSIAWLSHVSKRCEMPRQAIGRAHG